MESFANELKALADATQVLLSETGGADGQTCSLFQESVAEADAEVREQLKRELARPWDEFTRIQRLPNSWRSLPELSQKVAELRVQHMAR